jgi:dihydrofolate synthase/folylpolyglutamate synthase
VAADRWEAYLDSLEALGWRFGLERMQRLTSLLGLPQNRFGSIHVVGTNGKSSVTQMIAALLEAHGTSTGACISPHFVRWAERVQIGGAEIAPQEFAAAMERVAQAAEVANRSLEEGDAITQFEAATAGAFVAMAAAQVQAGVVEAGLGGRLDATNVIQSKVTVLTSVGLDHTEWLGDTLTEIAAEKLAVLRDGTTLVLGTVPEEVAALARETADQRGARLLPAPADPGDDISLRAAGSFQRHNFALAMAATETFLGRIDREACRDVAARLLIPGRLELLEGDPPVILDAAHNPDGAAALAESLPAVSGGRQPVCCLAVLADKDAAAMVAALAGAVERAICTEVPADALAHGGRPGARSLPAAELGGLCERAGIPAEAEPELDAALGRAGELARAEGRALLVAGSHYALGTARALLDATTHPRPPGVGAPGPDSPPAV